MAEGAVKAAVLLSGGGRTLENLLGRIGCPALPLEITAVVSSRAGAGGVRIAGAAGIPVAVFRRKDYADVAAHNAAINAWLSPHQPQIIILAGYLCFFQRSAGFTGPVVNIHPALLPKFGGRGYYGERVHEAVLAAGETVSGCTVHLVDDQYDHGLILGQQTVPVLPGDDVHSLAGRVFAAECELYPQVLGRLARQILAGQSPR